MRTDTASRRSVTALAALWLFMAGGATAGPIVIVQHDPDPSVAGQGIVVSTQIVVPYANPQPTGEVTISDGSDSCTARFPLGSCLWTPTTPGDKSLVATYLGDVNFAPSFDFVTHTVEPVEFPERISLGQPMLSFKASGWIGSDRSVAFSADGRYVAFISSLALIPADVTIFNDVYVLDRHSGDLSLVSVDDAGVQADNNSSEVAISSNGNFVAFTTAATNLAGAGIDTNGINDVFLHHRDAATTVRVSVANGGGQSQFVSDEPDISADGNLVAFKTFSNLSANDGNAPGGFSDVYVRDIGGGTTTLISVNTSASTSDADSFSPAISDDGMVVVFLSAASDLVGSDGNIAIVDAFMRDLDGVPSTKLISADGTGGQTFNLTDQLSLSPNGTKALFRTAGGLDPSDTGFLNDCYVRDLVFDTTALASFKADNLGPSALFGVEACAFGDTDVVYFLSPADDLVTGTDETNSFDLFKRELGAATTTRITAGAVDQLLTNRLATSDNGQHAAIQTFSYGLAPGTGIDLTLYSLETDTFSGLIVDRRGNQIDRPLPGNNSGGSSISADGRYVAFVADSPKLVEGKTATHPDVFVRDRVSGETERVSVTTGGAEANGASFAPAISADGRHVAFVSYASNLVPGDLNVCQDVFTHDRLTGVTLRVSADPSGGDGNGHSYHGSISADGRFIAFESEATNLIGAGNDNNSVNDVFRWDRTQPLAAAIDRISVSSNESEADLPSANASLSADGNKIVFHSFATNLSAVGGPSGQVFLRDVGLDSTTQISTTASNGAPDGASFLPVISGDGSYVAFWTQANNIAPTLVGPNRLLRRELDSGDYDAVLDINAQPISVANNHYANLSDDGRYLALVTSEQLDLTDISVAIDLNVYDFENDTGRVVVGPSGGDPQPEPNSFSLSLSGDGQYLSARCTASDLVTADTNAVADLFLFENPAFALELEQEVETITPDANDASLSPASDASGRYVVFQSDATDLGPPDADVATDIFRVDVQTGDVLPLSVNDDESPITSRSIEPSVSADGDVVLFAAEDSGITKLFGESKQTTLARAKAPGWSVLMRNRITGTTQRMGGAQPSGAGTQPQIAPGSTAVVFTAPNPNPGLPQSEIFHVPLTRGPAGILIPGTPRCVSCKTINSSGQDTSEDSNGASRAPAVSADGQWVAWETASKNMLVGVPSPCTVTVSTEIMLRNLITGITQRASAPVSPANCGDAGTGARKPAIDWAGRKLVFESDQPLKPGDANAVADVYLFDVDTRNTTRVSETGGGGDSSGGASTDPTISGDGEMVAFISAATNLDSEPDTNARADAHVRGIAGGAAAARRLSRTRSGDEADGDSNRPALNYNGTQLAFDSDAGNLAPGAQLGELNVFQRANPLNGDLVFGAGFE